MSEYMTSAGVLRVTGGLPGSGLFEVSTTISGIVVNDAPYAVSALVGRSGAPMSFEVREYWWNGSNSGATGAVVTDATVCSAIESAVCEVRDRLHFAQPAAGSEVVELVVTAPWIRGHGVYATYVESVLRAQGADHVHIGVCAATALFRSGRDAGDVATGVAREFHDRGTAVQVRTTSVFETSACDLVHAEDPTVAPSP